MKKIVFCLPGKSFSGDFLKSWSMVMMHCIHNGYSFQISQNYSCNIYYVRNMCLGGNVMNGQNQKPFNGSVDYDYLMWIDSDIIFTPQQFQKLIDANLPIVSGLYMMDGGKEFATVENWDEEYFKNNGTFKFMTPPDIANKKDPIPVSYTGFGFMLIKKGVFESMDYPWFRPEFKMIGDCKDFTMEDVSFCLEAKRKGYQVYVDPTVIVKHEKIKQY